MLRKSIAAILMIIILVDGKLNSQSIFGVDVSGGAQGTINWQQVKTSGMTFGFAKATEGFTFNDAQFVNNMTNGKAAGVVMGAYHFARPDNNSATDEANHFLSIAGAYIGAGYLPPVLDIEDPYASKISLSALNTWIQQWITTVQNSKGVAPIIYTSGYYANNLDNSLHVYKLWIADPDGSPTSPPGIGTWPTWAFKQYSWTGSVQGIGSAVDLDVFNGDQNAFNSLISGAACTTPNAPTATFGDDNCPGLALTNTQTASLAFTSNGGVSFKAQIRKYPYDSINTIFTSNCDSVNPIIATGLVKGMLYRWNMIAYGAKDCSSCTSAVSNTKYFQLPPEITVNGTVTSPVALCSGNITIATIAQSPGSGATVNYKWYKDGALFQQGNNLTSIAVSSAGVYNLIIDYSGSTNGCGGTVSTNQSNQITVAAGSVAPSLSISANPSGAICSGQSVTFTATPTYGGSSPSYQWKLDGNNVGTNSSTFSTSALTNGQKISCVMTSNLGCANPATALSDTVTVTVNPAGAPSITISQSSCNNNVVSFNSTVNNGGNAPSYFWIINGAGSAGSGGNTGPTFVLNNGSNGTQVQCTLISNAACANPVQVTSNALTVNCIVTAVQQVDTSQEIIVMPNPNSGTFDVRIKLIATKKVSFSLSTVTGEIVYQSGEFQMFGTQVKHFDQSHLPAGIYFLKIKIGMKSVVKKIIISR